MGRTWRLWGTLFVLAVLAVGGLLGFIVLPVVQGRAAGIDGSGVLPSTVWQLTQRSSAIRAPFARSAW